MIDPHKLDDYLGSAVLRTLFDVWTDAARSIVAAAASFREACDAVTEAARAIKRRADDADRF